ncbi:MAG: hypothetical protein LBM02_06130 [Lachnospiraceae bacterium]|nr:hypothetical protein [Lachnospiraceae bacterium]
MKYKKAIIMLVISIIITIFGYVVFETKLLEFYNSQNATTDMQIPIANMLFLVKMLVLMFNVGLAAYLFKE